MVKKTTTSKILFKELLRTIKGNWKQLVSIIAISFLSICLFCGLTSNAQNLKERTDYLYAETNYADIYLTTTGLQDNDFETIKGYEEVEDIEKRIYVPGISNNDSMYLIANQENSDLSKAKIIEGEKGLLIMDTYASANEIEIGDEIKISLINYLKKSQPTLITAMDSFLLEGKQSPLSGDNLEIKFTVSGTMYHPEGVQSSAFSSTVMVSEDSYVANSLYSLIEANYNITSLNNMIKLVYGDKTVKTLIDDFVQGMFNQILLNSSNCDATLDKAKEYFNQKEDSNLIIANKKESLACYQALNQDVTQAMQLTFVFPIIFFLVSVLVILTTLSQMIIKQRNQIGALKAIGVPKKNIYIHYIGYGVVLCFIGSLLGFIIGPLLIPHIMGIKYDLLWDLPSVGVNFFYPLSLVMVASLIFLAGLCSFFVSFNVIKEKPVDTLKPKNNNSKYKTSKLGKFFSKRTSVEARMAVRNIKRNKAKSIMVVLGMMGCTSLLVCGFGIMDTLNYGVDLDYKTNQTIDVISVPIDINDNYYVKISNMEEVERCEKFTTYPVSVTTKNSVDTELHLLEENSMYFNLPYAVEGGVSMDSHTAEKLQVNLNDEIKMLINGNVYKKNVTYIFTSSLLQGIFDLTSQYPEESFTPSGYYINLKEGYSPEEFKNKIEDLTEYKSLQTLDDMLDYASNLLSSIEIMTNVVKTFAILLCVVVIYNLTSLNISERSRDIATLKVLGFHYQEISKTLTYELAIDTLIGTIIGLFFGFPLTQLVLVVNRTELLNFVYHIQWTSYLIGFVVAFITSIVVSLILNLKSKKIQMAESLKSVE